MIHGRIPAPRGQRHPRRAGPPTRDRSFIWRFLLGLAGGISVCALLFLAPALYFVEQNYDTFMHLAYDVKPGLIQHLEREMLWLRLFFVIGTAATVAVSVIFGRRLLKRLLMPLELMEDHLKALTRGDWSKATPEIPHEETDRGFFLTYEHFHRSLRNGAEADLRMLEKLVVDARFRDSQIVLRTLIGAQRARLGLPADESVSDSSEESVSISISRRAS